MAQHTAPCTDSGTDSTDLSMRMPQSLWVDEEQTARIIGGDDVWRRIVCHRRQMLKSTAFSNFINRLSGLANQ